ncbi:MAG: putative Ig domain-containing protein, partial [Oscillatoria sp. PMC 1051.18]|nr:putative Ig domain-containing protein [Oscillatoria sp. PMC 1050.18]MEC5032113.1 putative Ig domain-containing protein [Oscillatoria sp. PMC 1051.18]
LTLQLSNSTNAVIEDNLGIGTIIDDDQLINNEIILSEDSNFQTIYQQTLEIPSNPSQLSFSFADLNFDTSDLNFINDAFEAALVDSEGNSLVHTIVETKNAFINFTESQAPKLADGVTLDNTTVTVNLSHLEPQTPATLILRLINDDSDTTTSVRITNIELQPSDSTIVPTVTPTTEITSDRPPINFNLLSDVSPSILTEYGQTSFNPQTQILSVELGLNNAGSYWFNSPLLVAVTQISDPSIQVLKTDGTTPEGLPYYDFSNLVTEGTLAPSESTASQLIHFFNPENIQFTYELVVLSQLNVAPIIESKPNKEILGGQPYSYQVIATDANNDELSYSLLVAPLGMTIDPATGLINWQTDIADVANHSLIIEVSDSFGGKTQQNFTLAVLGDIPNRPPNFTSTPVVDAWINQPYNYDADAIDPDQDNLNYSIIKGPLGLTVNSQTGNLEWTPPAVVVLGDTVLGQISLPGEQDEFSFSGSRGQRIYFDPLRFSGSTGDWDFQVFSPSGEQLVNTDLSYYNNKLLTLPENGNYRVVVSTSDDTTGNYGFSVIDIAQVPVAELDSLIEGQLAPGSEDDIYRFTANTGQKLFIDKISNSGSLDWVLYGPDNQVVSSSNYSDMELYLPATGEYLLSLRGKSSFTSNVEYAFEIITPDEVKSEISIGSHLAPVVVTDAIAEKGEEDLYTFTGTPGQRLYFDRYFRNSTYYRSHTASIISPSGEEILGYIFSSSDPEPLTLKEAGTYTVIIDAASEYTGTYSFSLLDPDLATEIDLDTNISGTIEPGQATHAYQFNGTAGQHLYFDSAGGTSYTNWTLYDSGNNQLTTANFNNDLEIVLDDSDTYTLLIQGDNSSSAVNYSFTVITPDTVTAPLNLDTTVTGVISEKGEQDVYTFTGTQGQHLFLDTLIDTSNLNATLLDPSGNSVFNTSMSQDYYRDPVILPESGTYQLIIDGTREATADYSFRLTDLTAAPILDLETPTSGIIEPGSEIKVYRLNANSGERLYFQGQASSSNPNWLLYSPGNEELINRQLNQDFEYVFSSDGIYYLILRGDGSTSDRFDYTLQVIPSTDTTSSLNPNALVSAEITTLGEQHNYTFTGSVGQQLYFNAVAGDNNLTAILRNPSGNIVWSGTTADDSIPIILTSDGSYELNIDGKNDATGSYDFKLLTAAAPLSFSSPTNGSISAQETALYQFNGTAGQQLSFESLTAVAGAEWTIYSQVPLLNGTTVIDSDSFDSNLAVVLPSNGSYTLAVRNLSETQLNYEFQVIDTSTAPIGNNGVETLHSGSIAVAGEVDNYTLTADAGTLVYFDGQQGSNIIVKLSAPDGSNVFNSEYTSSDDGAFFLAQTGTYTLEVNGTGSNTGNYSFKLVELTNASNLNLNTITNVPLAAKETLAYQFTGTVGQKIHFDGLNESNPSITARLLNANGRQIAYASDLRNNIDLQTLPGNGTYYLILQSNSTSTKTASFQILDDNNATPLILDSEISGDFGTSKRESQLYKFTANAGQRLYFDRSEGDYYYSLYAPDGKKLFDSNFSSDYEIDILPSDGEYTLVVSGYGYSNDNYRLRVVTPDEITAPMTVNNTVTGELLELGEQHIYTFTGNNNQRLFFDSLTGTGGITAQLVSPSGKTVISTNVYSDEKPVMLSETGTYRLVIDGTGDDIGTYSFRLLDWTSTTPISFDTPISGDFGLSQRETHLYRFSGTEGQELFFNQTAGDYWNYYALYGTDGKQFFNQRLSYDKELTLPYTGDYILALQGRGYSNNTYELEIVTPESLTNNLTLGETISSSISEAGETDSYTFTGTPGQILYFDSLFASSYYINAQLFTPSGKQLWNQDVGGDRQPFILPEVGTYTLKIARQYTNNDITDSYSFRLLDFSQATPVNFDTSLSGNFGLSQRETHLYTLTGTEGQELFFDSTQGDYYNRYTLYDQFGQIILDQHLDRDKEVILPDDGTYYLALRSFGDSNDNYQLQIVTPESLTTALTIGETISGEISEPGESDSYTFDGQDGQILYFDSLEFTDYYIDVRLIDADNREIWSQNVRDDKTTFVLNKNGTYTLVISGEDDNNITSSYSFRLLDFAEAEQLTLDTPINGNFGSSRRETHLYRLNEITNQQLYFDRTVGSSSNDYLLYDARGQEVFETNLGSDYELTLPGIGDYFLALRSFGNSNDTYNLTIVTPESLTTNLTVGETISGIISEAGVSNSYEFSGTTGQLLFFDNLAGSSSIKFQLYSPTNGLVIDSNTPNNGIPLNLTETGTYRLVVDGNNDATGNYSFRLLERTAAQELELGTAITGIVDASGGTQLYQFTGTPGQTISFDLDSVSNVNWQLYDPGNQLIAAPYASNPDLETTLNSSGLYTLAITGNQAANYSFLADETTITPLTPSGLGIAYSGAVSGTEVDSYSLTVNAGTSVLFDSLEYSSTAVRYRLINPDGSYALNGNYIRDDRLPNQFLLAQTGDYTLEVYGNGSYEFQLLELPQETNAANFNPLELGAIASGTLDSGRSATVYSFIGTPGQQVYFNGMVGNNVTVNLLAPNAVSIYSRDDFDSDDSSVLTLEQSGLYHLVLQGGQDSAADYEFQLLDFAGSEEMQFNLPTAGRLTQGQQMALYSFEGSAGERVYFDSLEGNSNNFWKLYAPGGREIIDSARLNADFESELPSDGKYTLAIIGSSSPSAVDYSFRVFSHSDTTAIVTPGMGESGTTEDGSLAVFPVQLQVDDAQGGIAFQDYQIRLWADPDNAAPAIISTPGTEYGLNQEVYQYRVEA